MTMKALKHLTTVLFAFWITVTYAESSITLQHKGDVQIVQNHSVIMGTEVGILISSEDEAMAISAIKQGFAEMRRIENLMTDWRDSNFELINQSAGIEPVQVTDEIMFLLNEAQRVSELTGGAFDISYAGVGKLWKLEIENFKIPQASVIEQALQTVGYQKIEIDNNANTVYLPHKAMRIGLGGIAKGYAVDRAVKLIQGLGFKDFAVNAGGDLTVKGRREGALWQVAIRHPRKLNQNIALLPISNGTVVTSGDNERYREIDGVRYSHIIDPRSGYPASKCQSVTVLAKTAYLADALATGIFVLGAKDGMDLVESLDQIEALIVDAQGIISVSSGLQGNPGEQKIL